MRISERQRYDITSTRVEKAKSDNTNSLEILSTQKRINHVSDDPTGLSRVIRASAAISNLKQFQKNLDFSRGYMERSEAAISAINDNLIRAKELAVEMANDTYADDSRDATAREVKELIGEVVSQGNTTYANRYVFSGFRTKTPALSTDGKYLGDDGAIFLQVDPSNFRQINMQARYYFEASPDEQAAGHLGVVDTLQLLYEGLMKDDKSAIHKSISEIDHQLEKSTTFQAAIGARSKALQDVESRDALSEELAVGDRSKIEDADTFKATSDFKRTETVLQGTLMASNKILQPSLLNFMQ